MKNVNFNDIYMNLLKEKDPELDKIQKERIVSCISFYAIMIILTIMIFNYWSNFKINMYLFVIFLLADLFCLFTYILVSAKYKNLYKQTVISQLVKGYSPNLNYNGNLGVSSLDYRNANYNETYNKFYSEDLIEGYLDEKYHIKMSEVVVEQEETRRDSEGNKETTSSIVFSGWFGYVDIPDKLFPYFEVSTNNIFNKYNGSRIEVDSAEFEKYFDLYTVDKIRTMQIFTADLIEEFNKAREDLKKSVQVKVIGQRLFFRFAGEKNSFEAPNYKKVLDFDEMYYNFKLIDRPIKLISKILENSDEV